MNKHIYLGVGIVSLICAVGCKTPLNSGPTMPGTPVFSSSADLRKVVVGKQVGEVLDLFGVKTKRVTVEDEPPGVGSMISFSHNGTRVYLSIRPKLNLWPHYTGGPNWPLRRLRETVVVGAFVCSKEGYVLE